MDKSNNGVDYSGETTVNSAFALWESFSGESSRLPRDAGCQSNYWRAVGEFCRLFPGASGQGLRYFPVAINVVDGTHDDNRRTKSGQGKHDFAFDSNTFRDSECGNARSGSADKALLGDVGRQSSGSHARDSTGKNDFGTANPVDVLPGKWSVQNRKKKDRKRKEREEKARILSGFNWRTASDEEVQRRINCPQIPASNEAEIQKQLKLTLDERRIAENRLQKKLAELRLADLEDEVKCRQYDELKKQRVAQWTNEARRKSQESIDRSATVSSSSANIETAKTDFPSVDRCATLPSSSAGLSSAKDDMMSVSSSEMRQVLKANSDLEFELSQAMRYIDSNQHKIDEPYLTPACASTEEIHEDMLMMGYEISESRPEDLATVLRSYAQEPDIRTIPHADRFRFRLNQLERRVNMNIECGI